MVRIKICCISSLEEAKFAISCGTNAVGLVSEMPSGPGVISDDIIKQIACKIPPGISSFLLTSKLNVSEIIEQQKFCGTNTIQLCDRINTGDHKILKDALPGISIVQVVHVNDNNSIEEALSVADYVDAILLDSGNQNLKIKELGGTGRVHNWELSKQIVDKVKVPVYLAGGLNHQNVEAAVNEVRPFGLDLCSGVRTNGKLDETKMKLFFEIVSRINLT